MKIIFSWGANSYGQLAHGHFNDVISPCKIDGLPNDDDDGVIKIFGGGGHSVFEVRSSSKNLLLSCGWNNKGQLGHSDHRNNDNVTRPAICLNLDTYRVVDVSCGWDSTYVVTDAGDLLAFGSNTFGQLATNLSTKYSIEPLMVVFEENSKVVQVAAGLRHAIVLKADGKLYTWGAGNHGQLGNGLHKQPQHKPSQINIPLDSDDVIIGVTAGAYHSGCWTSKGRVYLWGQNKHGQLGNATQDKILYPYELPNSLFSGHIITKLHSGWTHILAETDEGHLYSWGRNNYGQLGRDTGEKENDAQPALVEVCCPHFSSVHVGSEHNLLLTDSGAVFAWGWNEHGICGNPHDDIVKFPKQIEGLKDYCITNVSCGMGHNFAMADF